MTLLNTPETVTLPLQKSHKLRTLGMAAEITARLRMMIE